MGVGSGEDTETHLANAVRERSAAAGHAAGDMADRAREKVEEVSDRARQKVGDVADRARDRVTSTTDTARARAADGLDRAAGRLEDLVDDPNDPRKAKLARPAHAVAGGMEGAADFIRSPDVQRLRYDLESRIRATPGRTLLATFAVGFVIGRILR
jgi:uncharacterized protein YjbJ (UPF0337 family)